MDIRQQKKVVGSPSCLSVRPTSFSNADGRLPDILCLNCRLDGVTLVPTIRKPSDVPANGLVSEKNRDDRI